MYLGKLIVIEGLDGSGKATQTKLLYETLHTAGQNVRKVTFPDYESDSSALVRMYLSGEFGSQPGDVNAFAASAFYAVDRYASYKKNWADFYREGGVVLADRYTTSNEIHQLSKLPEGEWQPYVNWLEDFEYARLDIPRPDIVVYLDVEPAVSQGLLQKRYAGEEKRDIHEKDLAYLVHCREAAQWCIQKLGWQRVQCSDNGSMLDIETIAKKVKDIVKEIL